ALAAGRVARRRGTPALIAVVRDDDLVVLTVEEHAVRVADTGLRTADDAARLLVSLGAAPVDHDFAGRFDRDGNLVALGADREAPCLMRYVENAFRFDVAVRVV